MKVLRHGQTVLVRRSHQYHYHVLMNGAECFCFCLFILQVLYWLPKEPPPGIHILASVDSDSSKEVNELVTKRRYQSLAVQPLGEAEKESAALVTRLWFVSECGSAILCMCCYSKEGNV